MKAPPIPPKGRTAHQPRHPRPRSAADRRGQARTGASSDLPRRWSWPKRPASISSRSFRTPTPPVCKILDYGKFRFLEQKKAAEARKNQKIVEVKEIKLRPGIDDHDYDVKMKAMHRFFEEGDKVKVTLRFRGREMAHQDLGYRCSSG